MKFLHRPVTSLEDATANFEQLEGKGILDRIVAAGTVNVTFTASTTSNTATVTHGLGKAPTSVVVTPFTNLTPGAAPSPCVLTVGATTFTVFASNPASGTGTIALNWIATG